MTAAPSWLIRVWHFIRLGRPLFLAGGFLLHGLGVAMALYTGARLDVPALVWGQIAITATQSMTHYSNEYFDLPADLANATPIRWAGGSRVLVEGRLSPRVALATAVILGLAALGAALILTLILHTGLLALLLILLAVLLSWSYSAPPLRLHSRGLGELTVAIVVAGLTPLLGFSLQAGRLTWLPVLAVVPLCCLQFAMIVSIAFPDVIGDLVVGKRTLVVRLGRVRAAWLHDLALLVAYAVLPALVGLGLPARVAVAISLGTPLAGWQAWQALRNAEAGPARWNSLIFWNIVLLMGTAAMETLTFLWLTWR